MIAALCSISLIINGIVQRSPFNTTTDLKLWAWVSYSLYIIFIMYKCISWIYRCMGVKEELCSSIDGSIQWQFDILIIVKSIELTTYQKRDQKMMAIIILFKLLSNGSNPILALVLFPRTICTANNIDVNRELHRLYNPVKKWCTFHPFLVAFQVFCTIVTFKLILALYVWWLQIVFVSLYAHILVTS